jgi:hypothetical protein
MNRGQKNNNPVNLRYVGQRDTVGHDDKDFAVFKDGPSGWRAAHRQIGYDVKRGLTLKEFIYKFAPPNENDTDAYLAFVCKELKVVGGTPLAEVSPYALAGVMAAMEGYYKEG